MFEGIALTKYEQKLKKKQSRKQTIEYRFYDPTYSFGSKYKHKEILHTTEIGIYFRLQTLHMFRTLINYRLLVRSLQRRIYLFLARQPPSGPGPPHSRRL